MLEFLHQPWHWTVSGVLIGLTVPILLLIGNKRFGISTSFQHLCAAIMPASLSYFKYDWKSNMWNLFFVAGLFIGGFIASTLLANPEEIIVAEKTKAVLSEFGINNYSALLPPQIFSWTNLFTTTGLIFFVIGGLLVGFGVRWADGCTSGHAIMGLSALELSSLVATVMFMLGGILSTHFIIPLLF